MKVVLLDTKYCLYGNVACSAKVEQTQYVKSIAVKIVAIPPPLVEKDPWPL